VRHQRTQTHLLCMITAMHLTSGELSALSISIAALAIIGGYLGLDLLIGMLY
jgi:hypothetical protein